MFMGILYCLTYSFEMDAAVDGLQTEFTAAATDRPTEMLSTCRLEQGKGEIRSNFATESGRFNLAAGRGGKIQIDRSVHSFEIKRARPVCVSEPGRDVAVHGRGLSIAAGGNIDASINGIGFYVAAQLEGADFAVDRAANQGDSGGHPNPESDLDIVIADIHVALSAARLAGIRRTRVVTGIDCADRHPARVLDYFDLDLRHIATSRAFGRGDFQFVSTCRLGADIAVDVFDLD